MPTAAAISTVRTEEIATSPWTEIRCCVRPQPLVSAFLLR
jgi:hypothetical protein